MDTNTSSTPVDTASGTGIFKSSIFHAIKACRVSGARGESGQLRVQTEELRRELAETRTRASLAEQRVAELTAMLDDMREQWPFRSPDITLRTACRQSSGFEPEKGFQLANYALGRTHPISRQRRAPHEWALREGAKTTTHAASQPLEPEFSERFTPG